ncbi:TrbI/VirB10 family protein [Sphingobium sp. YR768]|uniref:TrbI/VirB10 family protein n=1 Tax=Sphingobium sp. YR768 TaxID=1884365 RepID=UPI0008BC1E3A|nr:TrbI/VirB10 family protein [Sphingobium sp. YR768]SES13739.1 type IV secretion system protein VirB10 [Sphingobium sp. YR768]
MTGPQDDPRPTLADRDVRPRVRTPSPGLSGLAIAALCAVLAIPLFLILDANRRGKQQRSEAGAPAQVGILSPQPLALPPALPEPAQPPLQLTSEPAMAPVPMRPAASQQAASPAAAMSYMPPAPLSAPARAKAEGDDSPLIIDLGMGDGLGNASAAASGAGDDQAVRASVIRNRANLVPQGSMISAVLETPIDSRRPGLVRAVVSRDARGFDGSRVLIPRGSRLIGEATGDVKSGQKRVLVNWTRLIRPDGVAIRIGSPAADVLGGAGIRGKVNNHVLERVTNAVLQSALTVGVNVASRTNSNNSVIVGLPGQVGSSVQNILPNVDSAPTIKVASGAEISVFVARDLDFSGTGLRR